MPVLISYVAKSETTKKKKKRSTHFLCKQKAIINSAKLRHQTPDCSGSLVIRDAMQEVVKFSYGNNKSKNK